MTNLFALYIEFPNPTMFRYITPISWMRPSRVPAYDLYVDWDGTITKSDTLSVLAGIGYAQHERMRAKPSLPPWSSFSASWIADYTAHEDAYGPSKTSRKTTSEEIDWLRSLKNVEERSITRVEAAGVFKGLDRQIIDSAAEIAIKGSSNPVKEPPDIIPARGPKVILRAGFFNLLQMIQKGHGSSRIISVNWSAFFIRCCLKHAALKEREREMTSGLEIVANEIHGLQNSEQDDAGRERSEKVWRDFQHEGKGLWTSGDKASILKAFRDLGIADGNDLKPFIYIGDSPTDLECLLMADIGIVVKNDPYEGSQSDMMKTLNRIGIEVKWIGDFVSSGSSRKGRILWWAEDFTEISNSKIFSP